MNKKGEDLEALIAFQKMAAAKTAEIAAAQKQKDAKEAELADLLDKVAKSKEDLEAAIAECKKLSPHSVRP